MTDHSLWVRLQAFSLDEPGADSPFSARLARENHWSLAYPKRTIEEYKRFLYLGLVAGHPVTPSEDVDQVWHLHLTYSRSYWNDLCKDVLRTPFHHQPTQGGPSEAEKFQSWYDSTLKSYATHFGNEPPSDIWPPPKLRFRPNTFQRINLANHWVIPRPQASLLLVAALGLVTAGCAISTKGNTSDFFFILFFVIVLLTVLNAICRRGKTRKKRNDGGCGGGCGSTGGGSEAHGGDNGCGASGCGGGGCGGGD